jgi:hypothetical protein
MKNITIKYGVDSITKQVDAGFTIGDLKGDDGIRAGLGYGDNVNALINGVAQGCSTVIPDGAVVTIETAANTKA